MKVYIVCLQSNYGALTITPFSKLASAVCEARNLLDGEVAKMGDSAVYHPSQTCAGKVKFSGIAERTRSSVLVLEEEVRAE